MHFWKFLIMDTYLYPYVTYAHAAGNCIDAFAVFCQLICVVSDPVDEMGYYSISEAPVHRGPLHQAGFYIFEVRVTRDMVLWLPMGWVERCGADLLQTKGTCCMDHHF